MAYNVEEFRYYLQHVINSVQENTDQWSMGVLTITRAIKTDFDEMFPPQIWSPENISDLKVLVEKHCITDISRCPICGEGLKKITVSKYKNTFYFFGCTSYPKCKGQRNQHGIVILNDAVKNFLSSISYKEKKKSKDTNSRFNNIILG